MGRRNWMPSVPRGSSKSMAELFLGGERKKKTGSHCLGEMFAPETCPELLRPALGEGSGSEELHGMSSSSSSQLPMWVQSTAGSTNPLH